MLLVIHGSSAVAEGTVANLIVKNRPEWRYVPPETIGAIVAQLGMEMDDDNELAAMFYAECIRGLWEEGCHVVQTASGLPKSVQKEMADEITTVFIVDAKKTKKSFDHMIDSEGMSAKKIYEAMVPLLKGMEA